MGLEKYYDKELNGDKGHVRFLQMRKDKGCLMLVMISKSQKLVLNLGLTIDARITRIMERNEYCGVNL